MPKIEIIFLDRDYRHTTDRVAGTPSVNVTIAIGGVDVISAQPAVVDTGAEFCVINAVELSAVRSTFKDQVRPADKTQIEYPHLRGEDEIYEGTITIHNLDEAVRAYFVPSKEEHFRPHALIGRHVLDRYTMIYDPLGGVFSLEKK